MSCHRNACHISSGWSVACGVYLHDSFLLLIASRPYPDSLNWLTASTYKLQKSRNRRSRVIRLTRVCKTTEKATEYKAVPLFIYVILTKWKSISDSVCMLWITAGNKTHWIMIPKSHLNHQKCGRTLNLFISTYIWWPWPRNRSCASLNFVVSMTYGTTY